MSGFSPTLGKSFRATEIVIFFCFVKLRSIEKERNRINCCNFELSVFHLQCEIVLR